MDDMPACSDRSPEQDFSSSTTGGLNPLNADQRRDLLEIVEDRYDAGSILITSQLPIENWHDIIGDSTIADAILDRIVHNAYRIELSGESVRKTRSQNGQA